MKWRDYFKSSADLSKAVEVSPTFLSNLANNPANRLTAHISQLRLNEAADYINAVATHLYNNITSNVVPAYTITELIDFLVSSGDIKEVSDPLVMTTVPQVPRLVALRAKGFSEQLRAGFSIIPQTEEFHFCIKGPDPVTSWAIGQAFPGQRIIQSFLRGQRLGSDMKYLLKEVYNLAKSRGFDHPKLEWDVAAAEAGITLGEFKTDGTEIELVDPAKHQLAIRNETVVAIAVEAILAYREAMATFNSNASVKAALLAGIPEIDPLKYDVVNIPVQKPTPVPKLTAELKTPAPVTARCYCCDVMTSVDSNRVCEKCRHG